METRPPTVILISDGLKIAQVKAAGDGGDQRRTKSGKFTLSQLRATDGVVPLQYGTNQFDSQKVRQQTREARQGSDRLDQDRVFVTNNSIGPRA